MKIVSRALLAGCAILLAMTGAGAQSPLVDEAAAPSEPYQGPFAYDEEETVVARSPAEAVAFDLPAGLSLRDYEASPRGSEVAVIVEDAARRQQVAFWAFGRDGFSRRIDVPPQTRIASVTWHPRGKALFLLATGDRGSQILKLDATAASFNAKTVYSSTVALRRLVVGPRPFEVNGETAPVLRLFFGEKLASGAYALRTVTENGKALYTVVGPQRDAGTKGDDETPNTTIAPSALPLQFHPAGNQLVWEDQKKCLHKLTYVADNWGKSEPFGRECGHTLTYTPNGIATIDWQPSQPGIRIKGLVDGSDQPALGEHKLDSVPSQMPDGRGVIALTATGATKSLRYLPISVPLADVANAWMYMESARDQQAFMRDRGLFRPLPELDQLFKLYDTESYQCGGPDTRAPTRPYFVTTDLFWELYSAAFDGLFIILEREQAAPAFARFVAAADAELAKRHAGSRMAKAFAAAHAVLDGRSDSNAEARLIVAARGAEQSVALQETLDFAQFKPRGHYTTDAQKRYFGAVRYLSALPLSAEDTALLRGLDAAVGRAAQDWIAVYRPFIASSRLDLVWGGAASTIASHPDTRGTRLFPLSWGWDNEALDNVVDHAERPAAERIQSRDGGSRLLPSGLDFAAIAGNRLANELLSGEFAAYPNLAGRIAAVRQRFQAAGGKSRSSLYDSWIAALATQWADTTTAAVAGPVWNAKRLQTGLGSWATLRHATVLVNDKTVAECGEGGFEAIVMQPPRGYVEPDPATFAAIADLFEATIAMVRDSRTIATDAAANTRLRDGVIRRLSESRDNIRKYQKIAEKELKGETLSADDYKLIQYVGRAAEHNFLIFSSLSNPQYALSNPDPMMKVVDVADAPSGTRELGVGRPLEWDQIVPHSGRSEIVKGGVYSYYEFASPQPLDDAEWRKRVDGQARPDWVTRHLSANVLSCPARQP
ncbi:hypothetical protein SSBR45G_52080 [Bradyrhizobium sp. SSBR45G]|uniref:DUF3160 domain-containing protein n=1 Tax=unclassified Bradyrhizobium TaxID=2631580 RepID=UPI002342AABB|nr:MULTISPECIES: DUF3160 domain-containing protein [unclassified Bradyrhizobium]GLH80299.1 hypothetical protein SSBR45G_52080 [Bradyrhizobium sp. SSBR45G]GLH87793.1 hypothetical protein SSBR45R_52530 [Bradyrhizobium sp. SSBR45R]